LNKINIVTSPDQLFNDSYEILLLYPSNTLLNELQNKFLTHFDDDSNIYLYDKENYNKEEVDWVLRVFKSVDVVIIDIDNAKMWFRDLISFMIAKNKTYWLTNGEDSVYNHISKNRVYNLDFLQKTGDSFEKE
jgi:hypothetical protein